MEFKVNDRVKIKSFIDVCRLGKVKFRLGVLNSTVAFKEGTTYYVSDLKRVCSKTVKITEITQCVHGDIYHIAWRDGVEDIKGTIRPYLVEKKVFSVVKCEITEQDTAERCFNIKVKEANDRREHNKRITREYNLNKGDKR